MLRECSYLGRCRSGIEDLRFGKVVVERWYPDWSAVGCLGEIFNMGAKNVVTTEPRFDLRCGSKQVSVADYRSLSSIMQEFGEVCWLG